MKKNHHKTQATKKVAHVIDVNMGYGHSRAAYALKDLGGGEIISANDYKGITKADKASWKKSREIYETISRFKTVPFVGDLAFDIMDQFQQIDDFYPRRDLSLYSSPCQARS